MYENLGSPRKWLVNPRKSSEVLGSPRKFSEVLGSPRKSSEVLGSSLEAGHQFNFAIGHPTPSESLCVCSAALLHHYSKLGSCGVSPPTYKVSGHPVKLNNSLFCLLSPSEEGTNCTWEIQKTQEKGLVPQISPDLLEPPFLKPLRFWQSKKRFWPVQFVAFHRRKQSSDTSADRRTHPKKKGRGGPPWSKTPF